MCQARFRCSLRIPPGEEGEDSYRTAWPARLATNPGNKPATEISVDGEEATSTFAKTWRVRYVDVAADEEAGTDAYVAVTLQRNSPFQIIVR